MIWFSSKQFSRSGFQGFSVPLQRLALLLILAVLPVALAGCAGSGQAIDEMPDWMTAKPTSDQYLYGAGTATSRGFQTALDKAELRAREDIASTVQSELQSLSRDFRQEVGDQGLSQFTQAQQEVVSEVLRGVTAEDTKVVEQNDRYRTYALVRMPVGEARKELLQKLSQEEAYTRLRKTEAFQQLEEEVKKYEESRE
jgi:hypothetical protein